MGRYFGDEPVHACVLGSRVEELDAGRAHLLVPAALLELQPQVAFQLFLYAGFDEDFGKRSFIDSKNVTKNNNTQMK